MFDSSILDTPRVLAICKEACRKVFHERESRAGSPCFSRGRRLHQTARTTRKTHKFTIHVDRIRLGILQKVKALADTPAESAPPAYVDKLPPQNLHPSPSNPRIINTPAESAGVQHLHPPPHHLHPTPAESAPITTNEPSLTTTTTSRVPFDHCGGGGFSDQLIYPVCTAEERIAIGELLATCPTEFHQKALDEIEGARQAGVIKTNLVPFARGIMTAISRGTFTVGHGTKVAAHRKIKTASTANPRTSELTLDPEALDKGKAFINRLARA